MQEVQKQQKESLAQIKDILKDHADDIAAILIEPIQCEGGDRYIPAEFFTELRNLADENDLLLIYDEVQTGFGTTGKMWGHEHFGKDALPDVISFSKKTQVGGIMANYDKFAMLDVNVFGSSDACKSRLNSTWGGNPVDMMRCTQFLKIIAKDNLIENAQKVGEHMLDGLRGLCQEFSDLLENPRGMGVLLAFDVVEGKLRGKVWEAFLKEQLLSLVCGSKTIRFRPHLDLSEEEADDAIDKMKKALKKI
jgi:L-lysine 6-transaminase